MTIEELIEKLTRLIKLGKLDPEQPVMIRNTAVSEEAMEAGSDGYAELSEVLVNGEQGVSLLIEEEW
jgi:hypothetical protein